MRDVHYPKLFEPGKIGRIQVKNRIVYPACSTNYAGLSGEATSRLIKYYTERAKGGVGLIFVEATCVKYPEGRNTNCTTRLDENRLIPSYQELAEAVHVYGAKIFIQLNHSGRCHYPFEPADPVAPSPIPCGFCQLPVRELTSEDIWDLVERYSEAALRTKKAGMDGVELHGAHGYLISQFTSAYTNQRSDEWGGSFERRMKFPLEIIKKTREKVGIDFPICYRLSGDEFVDGGNTLAETREIAKTLEGSGIDILSISAGIYESMPVMVEPIRYKEGWRVYLAEEIKKVVGIPVITVGQIKTPEFAEGILEQGRADFVALGRPLIADPEWPKKAAEGRAEDIRKCISCNSGCIGGHVFADLYMRCAINPVVGREGEEGWVELKPAKKKKKVMVVGGGPGGMEAARVASLRGHEVTLYEKGKQLGGQLILGSIPPGKDKLNYILEYYNSQLEKSGVNVVLGKEVDENFVKENNPDVLIKATGAKPFIPDIPGALGENILTYEDILSGNIQLKGSKVVIAGGGSTGCELALYLAERDNEVTIVEMLAELVMDIEPVTRFDFLTNELPESGVQIFTNTKVLKISDKGVTVSDASGTESLIEANKVVLALGLRAPRILQNVEKFVPEVHTIGDCSKPRKILNAIYEGALVARLI